MLRVHILVLSLTGVAAAVAADPQVDLRKLAPQDAVVIDPFFVEWYEVDTPANRRARVIRRIRTAESMTFRVDGPGYQYWWHPLIYPIDIRRYSTACLRYRAIGVHDSQEAAFALGLRFGKKRITRTVSSCDQLDDDGEIHEARLDLRGSLPAGAELTNVRIGLAARDATSARIELLGLWFQSVGKNTHQISVGSGTTISVIGADGRPAVGARVTSNPERMNWSRTAVTGPDGTVTVPSIGEPQGERSLQIASDGMVSVLIREDRLRRAKGLPAKVKLRPAKVYTAVVHSENGTPVPNARLEVRLNRASQDGIVFRSHDTVYTDEQGRWRTRPLDSIGEMHIDLTHPDYAASQHAPDRNQLSRGEVVLTIKRGHSVRGIVVDKDENPLTNATVRLDDYNADNAFNTNDAGKFSIRNVRAGEVHLYITAEGKSPFVRKINVTQDLQELRLQLQQTRVLKLRVVDHKGKPVPRPYLSVGYYRGRWWPLVGRTGDQSGRIEWADAPAEEVKYSISQQGYAEAEVDITANGREHQVTLYPLLRVAGKVTDAECGQPIQRFKVIPVIQFDSDFLIVDRDDAVDASGDSYAMEFDRTDVEHRVRIEAIGYRAAMSDAYRIGEPNPKSNFRLVSAPPADGRIVNNDGHPVHNVKVYLATSTQEAELSQHVDASSNNLWVDTDLRGRFQFPAQCEPYTIIAIHDTGYAEVARQPAQLPGDLKLQSWARIDGTLSQSDKAVSSARIYLQPLRPRFGSLPYIDDTFSADTDQSGRFVFERVPPIKCQLQAHLTVFQDFPITSSQSVPLDIQPGKRLTVNLAGEGGDVVGRVVLKDKPDRKFNFTYALNWLIRKTPGIEPIPAVAARRFDWRNGWNDAWRSSQEGAAYLNTLHHYSVKLSPNGTFLIGGVPAGEYELALNLYEPPDG